MAGGAGELPQVVDVPFYMKGRVAQIFVIQLQMAFQAGVLGGGGREASSPAEKKDPKTGSKNFAWIYFFAGHKYPKMVSAPI